MRRGGDKRPNAARRRAIRVQLFARQRGECAWCHTSLTSPRDGQLDRIAPGAHGGTYREDNLVLACGPCNLAHGLDVRMGRAVDRLGLDTSSSSDTMCS